MKERPILFSAPMVNAILSGRKTMTRRIVKPQPKAATVDCVNLDMIYPDEPWCWLAQWLGEDGKPLSYEDAGGGWPDCSEQFACPYGKPGDRLWLRETWASHMGWDHIKPSELTHDSESNVWWAADRKGREGSAGIPEFRRGKWRPSIHMPRWASRITLEITEVRVQRLRDISREDALAEGVEYWTNGHASPGSAFMELWDSINGPSAHHVNPWVWAITFNQVTA